MADMSGKVALVTGASRGLGESVARAIVTAGGRVLLTDIRWEEGIELAGALGSNAAFQSLDVSCAEDWAEAVSRAEELFGPVSVLVNNAVLMDGVSFDDLDEATFRKVFEVNELGCFLGMKAVAGSMRKVGGGSIVNISSIAGFQPAAGIAYCSSKWAIRGMSKSAARDLAGDRIRVNSVHPGWMDTPSAANVPLDLVASMLPLGEVGNPDDVARLVVFLASDEARFITGGEYLIDGGALLMGTIDLLKLAGLKR